MLYNHDFARAQELLRDDDAAEGVFYRGARVADYVGGAERDAEGGGGVDAGVHAGYWVWGLDGGLDRWMDGETNRLYIFGWGVAGGGLG